MSSRLPAQRDIVSSYDTLELTTNTYYPQVPPMNGTFLRISVPSVRHASRMSCKTVSVAVPQCWNISSLHTLRTPGENIRGHPRVSSTDASRSLASEPAKDPADVNSTSSRNLHSISGASSVCGRAIVDGRALRERRERVKRKGLPFVKKNEAWPCRCGRKSQQRVLGSIRPSPQRYADVRYVQSI